MWVTRCTGSPSGSGCPCSCWPFSWRVLFKVAQGSGTVAIITAATIMSPLVQASTLPYHTVYIAMAIGAGSKGVSWMNDSGFWVVKQMSGLTEVETLKTWTPMLLIMGFVAFTVTVLASWLLPHEVGAECVRRECRWLSALPGYWF